MVNLFSFFLILFFIAATPATTAQQMHTVSGVVTAAQSGEKLIAVRVIAGPSTAVWTNEFGFYALTLAEDSVSITFSYPGAVSSTKEFMLTKDTSIHIELSETVAIDAVEVYANTIDDKVHSSQMGLEEISIHEAKQVTAMFGEVDILKVMQLKPGVQSGIEGSTGMYVRGGSADQNHYILDDATIYNPSHLLGLFSTFNSDIVHHAKLYKAGFPAQFGGRLSSVMELRTKDGHRKDYHISGGLGIISARLMVEGPLKKDKGAFIVSGRRTYADIFTSIINQSNADNKDWVNIPTSNFFDFNVKLNYDISPKDRIFMSGYWGKDFLSYANLNLGFDLEWGNLTGTLRWNRIISNKLFVNTAFSISEYNYDIKTSLGNLDIQLKSGIRDLHLKTDFFWQVSSKHQVRFGASATYHKFRVGNFDASNGANIDLQTGQIYHAGEWAAFLSDEWTIDEKLKIAVGLRLSSFYNEGKFYAALEPRLALKYSLFNWFALKVSYARMAQYLHLVSTSDASLPTDIWFPSNKLVRPQLADIFSAGLSMKLGRHLFFNVEGYYKALNNQIDFREGARLFVNNHLDQEFVFGKGQSYGLELYLGKKQGALRGWIGYSLSWTWRQFDALNAGRPFHPVQDRRHDLSAVISWDIPWGKPKFPLTISASWVYGTGAAITLPTKRYIQTDITATNPFQFIPIYKERGNYRMADYHRLDLSIVWKLYPLKKKRFKSDITFSVYNVYDRRNPYFIYIDGLYNDDNRGNNSSTLPEKFQAKVVSLFPLIPSITWNFKW